MNSYLPIFLILLSCFGLLALALKKFSMESVFTGLILLTLATATIEVIIPDSGGEQDITAPY